MWKATYLQPLHIHAFRNAPNLYKKVVDNTAILVRAIVVQRARTHGRRCLKKLGIGCIGGELSKGRSHLGRLCIGSLNVYAKKRPECGANGTGLGVRGHPLSCTSAERVDSVARLRRTHRHEGKRVHVANVADVVFLLSVPGHNQTTGTSVRLHSSCSRCRNESPTMAVCIRAVLARRRG